MQLFLEPILQQALVENQLKHIGTAVTMLYIVKS